MEIVLATRNKKKIEEIGRITAGLPITVLSLDNFPDCRETVEDRDTFEGNAVKKAVEVLQCTGKAALADDSGLEVDALNGAPGVHSARFAALERSAGSLSANTPDADNNAKLLRLLKDVPPEKRTARFHCVIALTPVLPEKVEVASPVCYADEFEMQTELFDGVCEGRMILAPSGKNGFGYDPLFVPVGFERTFAELGDEVKNKLSHRAKALEKVRNYLGKRT